VLIDVRLAGGERGAGQSSTAVAAIMRAVAEGRIDPAATRVACDWIQYRNNFRGPLALRPVVDPQARLRHEIAVDLRRVEAESFEAQLAAELATADEPALCLEPWVPLSKSCIWRFNSLYWQQLSLWEEASGRGYAQALPGGESRGTSLEANRAVIEQLFAIWDGLVLRRSLPDQLTVLELGVGNGEQAKVWLDEFRRLDRERGTDYYRRLQYLMGDYSTQVLDRARVTVDEHRSRVSTLVLDAARPTETLRFLESKIFFVYISNVYDNLPTDELVILDDIFYAVETRASVSATDARRLAKGLGVPSERIGELAERLLRLGPPLLAEAYPEQFADVGAATGFWQEIWSVLHLAERYVPLGPLDLYQVCDGVTAEVLAPLVDGHGDFRFHVSNGALASFVGTVPLLHPLGWLTCHDLFTTDLSQCRTGFKGPGKYDGTVVNWVNGPLLRAVAGRRGFHVEFSQFAEHSRSPVLTATARARD
jgi:hypothetical protein